jgi:hypothetical protein
VHLAAELREAARHVVAAGLDVAAAARFAAAARYAVVAELAAAAYMGAANYISAVHSEERAVPAAPFAAEFLSEQFAAEEFAFAHSADLDFLSAP